MKSRVSGPLHFPTFVFGVTATAATAAARISASTINSHLITGQDDFVILDCEAPQRTRLLRILPITHTLQSQIYLSLGIAVFLSFVIFSVWFFRPSHPYADWTSRLPDPIICLLFFVQLEFALYKSLAYSEVMAFASVPIGVGMNLVGRIPTSRSFFGGETAYDGAMNTRREGSDAQSRTGRAMLRRKQGANGDASTSKHTLSSTNGIHSADQYYSGLYNTGNSCFLNSTLQSLGSLPALQAYLNKIMEMAETWDVPTPVTDALASLIDDLNTPQSKRSAFIPRQLTDALSNLPSTNVGSFFYAHQQQDAHELLVLLTGAVDDEMGKVMAEKEYIERSRAFGLHAVLAPSLSTLKSSSASPVASTSTNPFRSLVAQRTACLDCGYVEAVRHYPFDELSLAVPYQRGGATTIEACLKSWSRLERIDWVCFRCSVEHTLQGVRGDLKRHSRGNTNGHSIAQTTDDPIPASKMTNSKKKKVRDVRKKEKALEMILDSQYSEDEVESLGILSSAGVRLDRTLSRLSTKQVMLARTPGILSIHLNRSSYSANNFGASKNNTPVLFDEILDISDVVTSGELNISGDMPISEHSSDRFRDAYYLASKGSNGSTNGGDSASNSSIDRTLYRLCAIVVHYGSHSSGHYVCFRRRMLSQATASSNDVDHMQEETYPAWFRISDNSVSPCSLREVVSQNPFLLFYEKVESEASHTSEKHRPPTNGISDHKGQNGHLVEKTKIPDGFEHLLRNGEEATRHLYQPRIVERWSSVQ